MVDSFGLRPIKKKTMIILVIYIAGFLLNVLAAIIQSRMIASGVTQVDRDRLGKAKDMHNSLLGFGIMPSWWIVLGFFWFIVWPVLLIVYFILSLDDPEPNKNKLIEEAEEQGLDLREFVKKKLG